MEGVLRRFAAAAARWSCRTVVVLAAVGVSGCVILPRDPVPTGLMDRAVIPDMPDVRAPAGRPSQGDGE